MSEMAKTLVFLASGAVISALALFTRPGTVGDGVIDERGQPLFAEFTDPYQAKSLEIVKFDEGLGQISTFEVAQQNDQWVIPSNSNYPADAETRLKEAATGLVDLNVIGIASDSAADHELFGVVEPDTEKTQVGDKGVGTLLTMSDQKDDTLASLVIGKAIKDADDQRFVRVAGRDRVYAVKIDLEQFSTSFEDWIEKDLLKLSSFDIEQIEIKDYSTDTNLNLFSGSLTVNPEQRLRIAVAWNSDDYKWELDSLAEAQDGQLQSATLAEDEELNKESLDALKDALAELEIVNVERKPEGLKANLRAEKEFLSDNEALKSLVQRGYYPVAAANNQIELLCSDGEVSARTKDGVEYVLRFGEVASVETDEGDEGKANRFVFVTTRVHDESFPYPELEPLPGEEAAGNSQPAPLNESDSDADEKARAESDAETADDTESTNEESSDVDADKEDTSGTDGEDVEESDSTDAEDKIEDEKERITKENKRKLDEYEENRKKAEDKVKELNFRFADWYYVVSEDVYKKIHLGRADVIKKKEKEDEEDDAATDTSLDDATSSGDATSSLRSFTESNLIGGDTSTDDTTDSEADTIDSNVDATDSEADATSSEADATDSDEVEE